MLDDQVDGFESVAQRALQLEAWRSDELVVKVGDSW